ncbi:hypothetical protein FF098_015335 [Parvularcula flava]|uniref:Membrane protein n=1 Tax=Aquisalinus luteolus TaxID=1566827 RepID=A0A8J3A3Z8_9PROT|nr:MAPEG family protein [Aquisalinus luteolus]NHK29290.1 hypothetical protein [Aquisalinus luteolus]GGI01227.1 membrane protein [Aquisalinus luteolus]
MLTQIDRDLILWPVAVHLALIVFLYAWLSLIRKYQREGRDVKALEVRVSANLSNQFEAPVLFYALVAMLWAGDMVNSVYFILAWAFTAGRLWHFYVATLSTDIIRRGLIFTINFLAIFSMWALFLFQRLILT